MLKQFTIDETFITEVTEIVEHDLIKDRARATSEDLIRILQGHDRSKTYSNKDHPEFTRLRDQLEQLGYIETQRQWWNGDRVLKSFKLNEWTFRKGHKFCSAAAMKNSIACARAHGRKSISYL